MVVLLPLVALTMLAILLAQLADREEQLAVQGRDRAQVRALAEAGVLAVHDMVLRPVDNPGVAEKGVDFTTEADLNTLGVWRSTRGAIGSVYAGRGDVFFQGPFTQSWDQGEVTE